MSIFKRGNKNKFDGNLMNTNENNSSISTAIKTNKKFNKIKNKKFTNWWNKLQIQYKKNLISYKYQFDLLLSAIIICFLFLLFSAIILFSISFNYYTNGINIPYSQFFSKYASSSQKLTYHLSDFGLYHYNITIQPYDASSILTWIRSNNGINEKAILQILDGFEGPYLNSFGIAYVVFQIAILMFVVIILVQFKKYNKFLKLTVEGKKIWHYFGSCYGLILSAIIISSFVTEINVIPGANIIKPILMDELKKNTSPEEISTYVNELLNKGLVFTMSVFGQVHIKVIVINSDQYIHVSGTNSWWSWIIIVLYCSYIIILSTLISILGKFNFKYKSIIEKIVNSNLNEIKNNS